jgi:signal peptidase II
MDRFLFIGFVVFILDQVSKFVFKDVSYGIFRYTTNTGAAFGLFQGHVLVLSILSFLIVVLIVLAYLRFKKYYLPLGLIFGGALGNLIDRLAFGYVRDFIDFKIWPVFNIADVANTIGVLILIYILLRNK